MVLGRNRVDPSSRSPSLSSPTPVHRAVTPASINGYSKVSPLHSNGVATISPSNGVATLSPRNANGGAAYRGNGSVSRSSESRSVSRNNGIHSLAESLNLNVPLDAEENDEPRVPAQSSSVDLNSNGNVLAAAALSIIVPARRLGPSFPERLILNDQLSYPFLDNLTSIDQLKIHSTFIGFKSFMTCEKFRSHSVVRNALGQKIFRVDRVETCLPVATTFCCQTPESTLNLILKNTNSAEVLRLSRPARCACCCFPCCLQVVTVTSPTSEVLGSIHHEWSICSPRLSIKNAEDKTQFLIKGPVCTCVECQKDDILKFPVTAESTGNVVGRINRHIVQHNAAKSDATKNECDIHFNKELPTVMKALLLAATFLIDDMYGNISTVID